MKPYNKRNSMGFIFLFWGYFTLKWVCEIETYTFFLISKSKFEQMSNLNEAPSLNHFCVKLLNRD